MDDIVVGAGAAGLATAIFTRRLNPARPVILLEGATKPGAKILVSGGGRCNVTNRHVLIGDFWGGPSSIVRRVLGAFTVQDTIAFFATLGVTLHEEADGKLFPDSNRARDVASALLAESARLGVELRADHRVSAIARHGSGGFRVETNHGSLPAGRVVLATGGQSLPKSGSDGAGYVLASRLGHTIVPPVQALVPLLLANDAQAIHAPLSGVSHVVELAIWIDHRLATRLTGSLLWTHFGVSGPVVLNASRHWTRAGTEGRHVRVALNACPGSGFEEVDQRLREDIRMRPRASIATLVSSRIPPAVALALLRTSDTPADTIAAHLPKDERRRLAHVMTEWPLAIVGTRGNNYAEVTAGGVALTEIDPGTMASRVAPGLFLVGEILDVDGRIGGFNFQWAWSSAQVAARALART